MRMPSILNEDAFSWPRTPEDIYLFPNEYWNVHLGAGTCKGQTKPKPNTGCNSHPLDLDRFSLWRQREGNPPQSPSLGFPPEYSCTHPSMSPSSAFKEASSSTRAAVSGRTRRVRRWRQFGAGPQIFRFRAHRPRGVCRHFDEQVQL